MDIYGQQSRNVAKTWALMLGFLIFIIALGWVFSYIYDSYIILVIAVVIALGMNIFSYWFADKAVLKMAGVREVSENSHPELWNITENLCITAGLPMPKLYIIDDTAPNAFATGRNPEHSAVAVTKGLLDRLERNELEGVIAHELSHVQNRDILVMTIVVTLVGVVSLLSDFFLRSMIFGGIGGDREGGGQLKLIMIIVGIALAILSPVIAMIIKMAVSRKREFLADASGALLTRYPEGLANALEKISQADGEVKNAKHATAHLYISNPFGGNKKDDGPGFLAKLFMTHPPVEERIKALRGKEMT